jgi:hypothetical protein
MADLEIKTCGGENLVDMLPTPENEKIVAHIKDMYPNSSVSYGLSYLGVKTYHIYQGKPIINHFEVDVPPGCYVVRVHVCGGGNEWSDRTMVIARCGEEACVNVVIKEAETCIKEVMIPLLRLAEEIHLPRDLVQVAVDVLGKAGSVPIEMIAENLEKRTIEFKDVKEARNIVSEAESGLRTIKELRLKKKKMA